MDKLIEIVIGLAVYGLIIELFLTAKPRYKPMTRERAKEILRRVTW